MITAAYKEYRCESCRKLLFKGVLVESVVEIKCRHCHAMNTIDASQFNEMLCAVVPCPHRVAVVHLTKK